jgi:hypothetical protein
VVVPVLSPVGVFSSFSSQAVNAKSIDSARSNAMIFFILFLPPIIKGRAAESTLPKNAQSLKKRTSFLCVVYSIPQGRIVCNIFRIISIKPRYG